ncbi:uncharacterized protein PITG_06653 [Phytophthora infestans T30-4]|uniref:Anoctamin transmembrane domain-containing protein n=1 Tax=Phytophthora infestans (strain T30-4) TaxID=403677 RepID=D0N5C6_PHYIT|nr:uncharacterized protein PITG_06653 [Phytophthora infestans T30-4]EEY70084.1 conserved hypothetical protein [Phytophthora infestans T30-4]|eukprot:XP_002998731.1 conserved hypothetical protein [Phytophthora infestans T30-4]
MLAEFIKMAAGLIGPDTDHTQTQDLRHLFVKASAQKCPAIERWISHVCVGMTSSQDPTEFNIFCQHELVALLMVTFDFANSYLSWAIGVKLILLVRLILPGLQQAIRRAVSYVCWTSSRHDGKLKTVEKVIQPSSSLLEYEEALDVYLRSMRVKNADRIAAEREAFENEWSIRTGRVLSDVRTPRVDVSANDLSAIVRTLMLRRLTAICKLDVSLSVSEDGQLLLVRIFASDNLLLATLCETDSYRLQFADAIDPGRSFWHDKKEVLTDQKVLDANTAKHKLRLLLAERAMSPKEAVWFPGESLARVSARVHALSRISRASRGLIRCHNSAPAFASYSLNIQRQFIYKKYPNKLDVPDSYRRSAVLRTVDCIRLTKRIIDAEFDTNATIASGLLSTFHCLHSSGRFDLNSRGALVSSWIKFWRPVHFPGEFYPKDHAILNLMGRIAPFRQPLQDVRDYFGEEIAFYFAWLAFYGKMMIIPAAISMAALVNATIPLVELLLGVVVIAWSFVLAKLWERRRVWYQLQWGHSLCSSIQRQIGSWLCVLVLGYGNLVVTLAVLLSQGLLADVWGEKLAVLGSCICQAFLVQWNGACIPDVAHALSKWEAPHCSRDYPNYQSSFVAKLFMLQLFNTFTGLALLMLSDVGGLSLLVHLVAPLGPLYMSYNSRIEGHVGIFIQMETLLVAILAVQLSIRILLILSAALSPYPGPHKDYVQIMMQLGLVTMFSSVCPLLPLLALVDCAVKLRQNALELCCIRQRPEPGEGDDVGLGLWASYTPLMVRLSVPVALSLALFTADNFADISVERRVGYMLIGVLSIWLVAQLLWFLIPSESRAVEEARARNIFLVERYVGHAEQALHHYEERLELLHRLNQ